MPTNYDEAKPDQFGNLHERMKFLIAKLEEDQPAVPHDVTVAIYDLEMEVKHYKALPSFGQRHVTLG